MVAGADRRETGSACGLHELRERDGARSVDAGQRQVRSEPHTSIVSAPVLIACVPRNVVFGVLPIAPDGNVT